MPYYCTVPRCTSMAGKAKNVSFHQFPRDEELAKLWNKILKRGKPYTKYSKVCSLHFTPEDYTITSVGKNKGQWRTLRKDAIPSQNLPSESPTPYQRKQWSSWARDQPSNYIDPTIHQHIAQAIYMQTMLAMQAAGATDMSALNHSNGFPSVPTEAFAHTSTTPDADVLKGKQTNAHVKSNSFKCTECSKCFKDPDVFILHKRSHEKNEKENFNLNLTLQANPILANLLKTNTENSNICDNNFNVEMLMRALAANMEGYMRNFASMIKSEDTGHENHDDNHENSNLDDHENGNLDDHENGNLDHDRGNTNHMDHEEDNLGNESDNVVHDREELNHSGNYDHNNVKRGFNQDCQSTSSILNQNSFQSDKMNHNENDMNHVRGLIDRDSVFNDKIIEHYRNNAYDSDRSVRYNENIDSGSQSDMHMCDGDRDMTDHVRSPINDSDDDRVVTHETMIDCGKQTRRPHMGMIVHDRSMTNRNRGIIDRDRSMIDDDKCNGHYVTNDNDSQGSSDESICDLNESIDSNKLVIDETA